MRGTSLFDLTGKTALVSGGGGGLGFAMARGLARAGAKVTLCGRNTEKLEGASAELAANGYSVSWLQIDVANERSVASAFSELDRAGAEPDIVVNNAGIIERDTCLSADLSSWARVVDTNLTGSFILSQAAGRRMKRKEWGRIICIGSVLSQVGRDTSPAYVASKHGLIGLIRALAAELGPHGVTANAICPGYFKTEINVALHNDPGTTRDIASKTPVGRWGDPHELEGACVFLASNEASYVNGHALAVDGGFLAVR